VLQYLLGLHINAEDFGEMIKKQTAISLFKEGKMSSGNEIYVVGLLALIEDF